MRPRAMVMGRPRHCPLMSGSGTEVVVRAATRPDIPAIVKVATDSVNEEELTNHGGVDSDSPFRDVEKLSAVWTDPNRVKYEEILVAELGRHVVGVVAVEERGMELELVDIDVARDHQGRGIGTRMVEFVEEQARSRGMRAVTLGTSRNPQGIPWKSLSWWEARGYRITHEEENPWTMSLGQGFREVRMRKEVR